MKGIYLLHDDAFPKIYSGQVQEEIGKRMEVVPEQANQEYIMKNLSLLQDVDVIFSGWGCPQFNSELLEAAPRLKALFYGAGSIKYLVTEAFWKREIVLSSAYAANAVPVAEYTISQIIFSLKRGYHFALTIKREGRYPQRRRVPGSYGSTVGIISVGMIGRMVCEWLQRLDVRVIAYAPFMSDQEASLLNINLVSLEDIFREADVVSLHAPWLKETEGMIEGRHFELMKPDSTFINTARGAIVREQEMIDVLQKRPDLYAVLDVTYPEPPQADSPLYTLPNVILTPHIAGSMDQECQRMGEYMLDELDRYLQGEPLKWQITKQKAERMA